MDEQKFVIDSLQTINFTFPAVTWKNIPPIIFNAPVVQ